MQNRVKKRIFSGATCDQLVYTASARSEGGVSMPRMRFKNDEERMEHRRRMARRHCAELVNTNCTAENGYYCTLTFNRENEIHDFDEARRERNNFRRRLMRRCPDAVLFIFMGKGKSTSRIHFHMIAENVTPEEIQDAWHGGNVCDISHLRAHNFTPDGIDLGADFTAVSDYCFDHWTPEQGSGHYYCTAGKIRQPEEEEPVICAREYTLEKPPIAPKGYKLVSSYATSYGFLYFHYVKIPHESPPRTPHKHAVNMPQ